MTNQAILEELFKRMGKASDKEAEQLDNICNMLHLIQGVNYEKQFPQLVSYLKEPQSRLSPGLKDIIEDLKNWISKNTASVENTVVQSMNRKTKALLVVFLVIISAFALVALVFTVLNLIYGERFLNGWGDKIAGALGTLDFALGALGFILERIDDLKKKDFHNTAELAKESGDFKEFTDKALLNIKIVKSFNRTVKIGKIGGDRIEGDKIVNYTVNNGDKPANNSENDG